MLMTKSADQPTKLGRVLVDTLRKAGDWQTRQQIADAIGRTRLNPHDVTQLQHLSEQGLIEMREVPLGVARTQYEYRIKQ